MIETLKNILIIDIETAGGAKNFDQLSDSMQHHWLRKSAFIRNEEEHSGEDLYSEKAAIYAEFGKVIVIAVGIFHETKEKLPGLRITSFEGHDEAELLKRFSAFLTSRFDQKKLKLCAHNGKEFDYPYLCRRMLINGIQIPEALDQSGKKPWEVNHLDTMDMWKFGDRKSFTSLDLLTTLFGIPSSKSDIDGSKVHQVYYNEESGLEQIAAYCRGDVMATAQLYLRLLNYPLIENRLISYVSQDKNE